MRARIVELASKGLTDEQIAERLGCTPRHVAKVRQAAGILHKRGDRYGRVPA